MRNTLKFLGLDDVSNEELSRLEGYGLENKDNIYKEVRERVEFHIKSLSNALNSVLGYNYSVKFWRICIGHWLSSFVSTAFFRNEILTGVYGSPDYKDFECPEINDFFVKLSVKSTLDWQYKVFEKNWNKSYTDLAKFILFNNKSGSKLQPCAVGDPESLVADDFNYDRLASMGKSIFYKKKYLIYKSYLESKTNIFLHLRLGILPTRLVFPQGVAKACNVELRKELLAEWEKYSRDNLDRLIINLGVACFPRTFLEGFSENSSKLEKFVFDKDDVIFTSNAFDQDDCFQLFSALSVENGAKYYIGQHGNNWVSSRHFHQNEEVGKIADLFISWGLEGLSCPSKPAFVFKSPRKSINPNRKGPILLVLTRPPTPHYMWDRQMEYVKFEEEIEVIINALLVDQGLDIILRFHKNHDVFGGKKKEYYMHKYPGLVISDGYEPMEELKRRCSLVLETYHTTGMLENLSAGFPSLMFWSRSWELSDKAAEIYADLESCNILHHDIDTFIEEVIVASSDVKKWCNDVDRQSMVENFTRRYALLSARPVRTLFEILRN